MVEDATLVTRHQIVADLGQRHRLAIGGEPAQHERAQNAEADRKDEVAAPLVENLVDDRTHDPGGKGRRGRNDQRTGDGDDIGPAIFAAVLGDDATQDRPGFARQGLRLMLKRLVQIEICSVIFRLASSRAAPLLAPPLRLAYGKTSSRSITGHEPAARNARANACRPKVRSGFGKTTGIKKDLKRVT